MSGLVNEIMSLVKQRDPYAPEFHQAVLEVVESLEPCIEKNLFIASTRLSKE